jgi:hypothetical protein
MLSCIGWQSLVPCVVQCRVWEVTDTIDKANANTKLGRLIENAGCCRVTEE